MAEQKSIPIPVTLAFYTSRNGDYTSSQSAFQFHLAETDDYIAASGIKKLGEFESYPKKNEFYFDSGTTHWFFEKDRADAYNPQAANLCGVESSSFL